MPLVLVGGEQRVGPRGELVAGVVVVAAASRCALQLDELAARVTALAAVAAAKASRGPSSSGRTRIAAN